MIAIINIIKNQIGILIALAILLTFIICMFKLELLKQEDLEKIENE